MTSMAGKFVINSNFKKLHTNQNSNTVLLTNFDSYEDCVIIT